ncbi:hypothetical protein [Deinococcus aerophilus]|uniref:Uncharacterized protein n=1 Tax=Deinococcus aerophilus TaxID=522488 RepID=A0ABQ2GL47_9DEIO|nr:hypothetical protein [Deinococcus aerophilus]GGL99780.1 hypothetical protein GCM10010841_05500 [Deinococcus aerophilus]
MTANDPETAALLLEGDRLARHLAQTLGGTLHDQNRLVLLGRSLALNLVRAFGPTVEHVTRRAGTPLHAVLTLDERDRAVIQSVSADGEVLGRLPVDDLLGELLFVRGQLHPDVRTHLQDGLTGDEHHATRALVACLKSRPVLSAMERQVRAVLREARATV